MRKTVAAAALAAALGLGGLGAAVLDPLQAVGAQEAPAGNAEARPDRAGPLERALASLVEDGTLTQEQAGAVRDRTKAEAEAGKEKRQARRAEVLEAAATAIGSTPDEVKAALADGTSIAAQAEAAGVERQVVDDAVTEVLAARIDAAVADGRLTEERAAKAREHLDRAVDRILDADGSRLGRGGAGRRGN